MVRFQIQEVSSNVNWTGKKVLGLHTGHINIQEGFLVLTDGLLTAGQIRIDMTSIVISDIIDKKTNDEFLGHLRSEDFFGGQIQHFTAGGDRLKKKREQQSIRERYSHYKRHHTPG